MENVYKRVQFFKYWRVFRTSYLVRWDDSYYSTTQYSSEVLFSTVEQSRDLSVPRSAADDSCRILPALLRASGKCQAVSLVPSVTLSSAKSEPLRATWWLSCVVTISAKKILVCPASGLRIPAVEIHNALLPVPVSPFVRRENLSAPSFFS